PDADPHCTNGPIADSQTHSAPDADADTASCAGPGAASAPAADLHGGAHPAACPRAITAADSDRQVVQAKAPCASPETGAFSPAYHQPPRIARAGPRHRET